MNDRARWFCGASTWLVAATVVACSSQPPAAGPKSPLSERPASAVSTPAAEPANQAIPELPSGALKPVEHAEPIVGTISAAEQTGDLQTFLVTVPSGAIAIEEPFDAVVTLRGSRLLSVLGTTNAQGRLEVWLRRRLQSHPAIDPAVVSTPAAVDVYTAADLRNGVNGVSPGQHYHIVVELPHPQTSDPKLVQRYLTAVGSAASYGSPIRWLLDPTSTRASKTEVSAEWTQWMRLTSGYDSIEAALASAPAVRDAVAPKSATVAMKTLTPPRLRRHPWPEMLKALPDASPKEPLADLLPADFYFMRCRSFEAFESLLARVDELVSPILGLTTQRREVLELSDRYRLELGLPEGELTRVLGPKLISTLAVVGSDPLLRQGSDVSVLMAVPSRNAVIAALAVRRAELGSQSPLKESTWSQSGVEVASYTSANGAVRQQVAYYTAPDGQDFVLVSNSPNAVRRIIDVWSGNAGKLSDEPDFQYMLRRDQLVKDDVLGYLSDKFVGEVVSPRQRILEVRRQVAKSELSRVGYAALLHAQLFGALPSDLPALAKAKLADFELKHTTGEHITYSPTAGPQSSWGSVARLTSIIDLPTPPRVSKTEQDAYQVFVQNYEQRWGENIDPIAMRITTTSSALDAHVRILPVANINDYSEIARFSAGGSTNRSPSVKALAGILAIGEQSELRSLLSQQGESFLGTRLKLDWLGDWVEVGLADEALLAETALAYGDFPHPPQAKEKPHESDFDVLAKLPLYVTIDIKSAAGAALILSRLRELATEAAPDVVRWGELKIKSEHKIVRVAFDEVNVYYCLSKNRLTLSPDLPTLKRLLNQGAESPARESEAVTAEQAGGQLVVEFDPRREGSALRSVAAWLSELGIRETGVYNPLAELLLQAARALNDDPRGYRQLSLTHLGGIPVTPDGAQYQRLDSGLLDPARGTLHAPSWPKLPVSGSAMDHILRVLRRMRTEVSIDAEPGSEGTTSLRTRLILERQH